MANKRKEEKDWKKGRRRKVEGDFTGEVVKTGKEGPKQSEDQKNGRLCSSESFYRIIMNKRRKRGKKERREERVLGEDEGEAAVRGIRVVRRRRLFRYEITVY